MSWGAGVSGPQAGWGLTPRVRDVRLGTVVNGVASGVRRNAPYIGVAALSFWFIGWMPRICSTVRIIVICE